MAGSENTQICISNGNSGTGVLQSTFLCLAKEMKYMGDLYVCFCKSSLPNPNIWKDNEAQIPNLENHFPESLQGELGSLPCGLGTLNQF